MRPSPDRVIISLCTPKIGRKAVFFHKSKRKHNKHSEKYLTHQVTASIFMEKWSFVGVRKLGLVFGNSAP